MGYSPVQSSMDAGAMLDSCDVRYLAQFGTTRANRVKMSDSDFGDQDLSLVDVDPRA